MGGTASQIGHDLEFGSRIDLGLKSTYKKRKSREYFYTAAEKRRRYKPGEKLDYSEGGDYDKD
jgi:hypothetical protein